jgi:uncharacterized protein (DUF305 family)
MDHYPRLAGMLLLSFAAMYVLMYAMVNALGNVFHNVNQVYMAGLMAAPMALIELALMGSMYRDKRRNMILVAASVALIVVFWLAIRLQLGVGDRQFLRSMIPHHAGAILMCQQATVADAEIASLCQTIITSQQEEIDQMKAILARLDR